MDSRSSPTPTKPLSAAARNALLSGNTIAATKALREEGEMSLRDAKVFIEQQVRIDPELARALLQARERGLRSLKIAAMAIGGVVLLVATWLLILQSAR